MKKDENIARKLEKETTATSKTGMRAAQNKEKERKRKEKEHEMMEKIKAHALVDKFVVKKAGRGKGEGRSLSSSDGVHATSDFMMYSMIASIGYGSGEGDVGCAADCGGGRCD